MRFQIEMPRRLVALVLVAAAAAWSSLYGGFTFLFATPYQRAARAAWCGVSQHSVGAAFLGHCAACWAGASALLALAALVWLSGKARRAPAPARAR